MAGGVPRAWDDATCAAAEAAYDAGETWAEVGARFGGVGAHAARSRVNRWRAKPQGTPPVVESVESRVETQVAGDGGVTIESPQSGRIRTLDDLLAAAEVDLARYAVEKYIVNKWEVGTTVDGRVVVEPLWQVKAWLKPIGAILDFEAAAERIIARMAEHAPVYSVPPRPPGTRGHLLVVSPADLHMGMLAWAPETGQDYDTDIAQRLVEGAVETLIERARPFGIERILLVVGNDLMHADSTIGGAGGQTTKGTPLDVDSRLPRVFERAFRSMVTIIDRLRAEADVDVRGCVGNHDRQMSWALVHSLAAWYRQDKAVHVENPVSARSYYEWRGVLLGITHGDKGKTQDLPLLMAAERPEAWARCTWWAWLCGHRHAAKLEEKIGVRLHILPSLAGPDAWHAGEGYRHRRACEALVFADGDYVATLSVSASALGEAA